MRETFPNRMPHLQMAVLALLAVPGIVFAQVSYVRELSPAPGSSSFSEAPIVSLAHAPVDTSDPLYDPEAADTQWIISAKHTYAFDIRTGAVDDPLQLPQAVQVGEDSVAAIAGVGTTAPLLRIWGRRGMLYAVDMSTRLLGNTVAVPVALVSSLAAQGNHLTMIADERGYSVDPDTGVVTEIFQTIGGTALGDFSLDTHFQAYGANGLLYVLDYGNGRMQMLDPEDSFAAVGQFNLQAGVTTANFQFAIGSTGHIYLGDGEGGGSVYTEDGTYTGLFYLPESVVGTVPPPGSSSYLSTDQNGGVYVFDSTGFHQYHDLSVVPEPATWGVALGAGLLVIAALRRRRALR